MAIPPTRPDAGGLGDGEAERQAGEREGPGGSVGRALL